MKRILFSALLLMFFSMLANGVTVSFNTNTSAEACGAAANCSGGGSLISFSNNSLNLVLSYNAQTASSPAPFSTNFGSITVTCAGATCGSGNASWNITGATLQLAVTQTAPTPGSTFNVFGLGTFSGTVNLTNGVLGGGITTLSFAGPISFTNNTSNPTVTYALDGLTTGINSNQSGAVTTINGTVTSTVVPEPGTFTIAALGIGVAAIFLRRKVR